MLYKKRSPPESFENFAFRSHSRSQQPWFQGVNVLVYTAVMNVCVAGFFLWTAD